MENQKFQDFKLVDFDLSIRTFNVLKRNGYKTVGDILKFKNKEEILNMRCFNRVCGAEVAEELKKLGVPDNVWYEFLFKTT